MVDLSTPRPTLTSPPIAKPSGGAPWRVWPDPRARRIYRLGTEATTTALRQLCGANEPPEAELVIVVKGTERAVTSFDQRVSWPLVSRSLDSNPELDPSSHVLRLGEIATHDLMDLLVPGPIPAGLSVTAGVVSEAEVEVLATLLGPLDALRSDEDLLAGDAASPTRTPSSVTRAASSILEHGGIVMLLAVGAQGLGNLVFHAIAARVVGPAGYGALGALLAAMLALAVPITSVQVVVTRSVAELESRGDARRLLQRSILVSIAIALATMLASPVIASFLHLRDGAQAALIGPYVGVAMVGAVARGIQAGRRRFGTVAASYGAGAGARVILGILLIPLLGVTGALFATIASELVSTLVAACKRSSKTTAPVTRF